MQSNDIQSLDFNDPIRVNTKRGARMLRKAKPTSAFWEVWRSEKDSLKAAGYSVTKDDRDGWVVCHWSEIEENAAAIKLSQASDSDVDVPVPDGLEYLPFQRAGIAYAASREATLIADEMGLGKTVQAAGLINLTTPHSVLIICPASLKLNWQNELNRWLVRERSIDVVSGDEWPDSEEDIVIINYDILTRHKHLIDSKLWDLVIFDEAHYCKNPKAARTKMALSIKANRKLMLTGTPMINRPVELQPLAGYLAPEEFGHFFRFAKRYCDARQTSFGWDFSGSSNLAELQSRLRESVMVRRMKADVLTELPAKRRQVLVIPANTKDMQAALADEMESMAEAAESTTTIEVLFEDMSKVRHRMALAKVGAIIAMLEDIDHPVVVFCHHHDVVAEIEAGLEGRNIVTLTGQHSAVERQAAVEAFQNGDADVFIGTIGAAGVGITLNRASHVVFAELDWTPGGVSQAEDRCHRIGQTDSVLVQHVVVDQSIDARMAQLLVQKQAVLDAALDDRPQEQRQEEAVSVDVNELINQVDMSDGLDLSDLPDGRYAVPGGDTRLKLRVSKPQEGRWLGYVFVNDAAVYGEGTKYGMQSPGSLYRGDAQDALRAILEDPFEASRAYGLLTETCGVCGRALEDPVSVERGIGPICASRF